jgi:hypothetical protein
MANATAKAGAPKLKATAPINAATVCVLTPAIMTPGWCRRSLTMPMRNPMPKAVRKLKVSGRRFIEPSYASMAGKISPKRSDPLKSQRYVSFKTAIAVSRSSCKS